EGLYASPAHPEVQNRVYRVWMDLAERYDLDGLHFDYVRYPNRDFDYSRGALDAFRAWAGPRVDPGRITALDAGARAKPTAWPDALPDLWDEFRRAQVTGLVRRVYLGVKTARPDFVVSAAVFADAEDASRHRFQDWMGWLEAGILDVAAPMAYTNDDGRFRAQIRDAVQAARDPRRVWAGIGAYANTSDGTVSKIGIARQEGAGGVVLFSYDWATAQGATRGVTFLERVGRASFRDGGGGG
ncbi:MAG TPA: family 10 glycosylhydrolase, partial [Longimicrobiales bacterium]